ncbi:hypothetical protein IAT38_004225 [Cryptococcus sp. DSM 104549]
MMFIKSLLLMSLAAGASVVGATAIIPRGESHNVQLVNRCGSGEAVFLYANGGVQGSGTVMGPLEGGVAWIKDGQKTHCQTSGVDCGIVEFTLVNDSGGGQQNSADYSLLTGPGLGNHQFTYSMDFQYTGSCTNGPGGQCTGNSAAQCPGAYLGSATAGGAPTQCLANNVGIVITFC